MACLYKRRRQFWINYYLNGKLVQKSLHTVNERVATAKKKQIEHDLALGDLHLASKLSLPFILEEFCGHLKCNRTHKWRYCQIRTGWQKVPPWHETWQIHHLSRTFLIWICLFSVRQKTFCRPVHFRLYAFDILNVRSTISFQGGEEGNGREVT